MLLELKNEIIEIGNVSVTPKRLVSEMMKENHESRKLENECSKENRVSESLKTCIQKLMKASSV